MRQTAVHADTRPASDLDVPLGEMFPLLDAKQVGGLIGFWPPTCTSSGRPGRCPTCCGPSVRAAVGIRKRKAAGAGCAPTTFARPSSAGRTNEDGRCAHRRGSLALLAFVDLATAGRALGQGSIDDVRARPTGRVPRPRPEERTPARMHPGRDLRLRGDPVGLTAAPLPFGHHPRRIRRAAWICTAGQPQPTQTQWSAS